MNNQTFDAIVKVMDRGLIVIPKQIREELGISKNSYVEVKKRGEEIVIKPITAQRTRIDDGSYLYKGLKIWPAKYTKDEALKILSRIKGPIWTKKDHQFWKKGRKEMEERMKKIDKLEPYWES